MTAPIGDDRAHAAQLRTLAGAKVVSSAALRWVGPFLPTLERAFRTSTGTLTQLMGVAQLGGLTTLLTGPLLAHGRERTIFALGMAGVAVSSLVALGGSVTTFAISFVILVVSVANLTSAGHAWIGNRVAYERRSRAMGMFEMSWAIALLVGAPLLAVLIAAFGWRGPYVALAIAAAVASLVVYRRTDAADLTTNVITDPRVARSGARLPAAAWPPILAAAAAGAAGLTMFVVSGTWLDDVHGLPTGGLGVIAAGFGAIELVAEGLVASTGDRLGARRSAVGGLCLLLVGLTIIAVAGDGRVGAVIGLLVVTGGFEFGFVSVLTLVSEASPAERGRAIGISNACGTAARATAIYGSGQLYEEFGIGGSLALSASAAMIALALLTAGMRRERTAVIRRSGAPIG